LPSRRKAFGSHHVIARFTDFLVHKFLFAKGLLISSSRNSFTKARQQKQPTCTAGVPNLSLTMYPFSIPTEAYVPFQHFEK